MHPQLGRRAFFRKPGGDGARFKKSNLGQASLEAMVIFSFFMLFLLFSLTVSSRLASVAQQKIDRKMAEANFHEFSSMLAQACSLGKGNVRLFHSQGGPVKISGDAGAVAFEYKGISFSSETPCTVHVATPRGDGMDYRVENIGSNEIEVS